MDGPTSPLNSLSELVLLADIGGTNCRLGIYDPLAREFISRAVYSTEDFNSPREAFAAFLARGRGLNPRLAALALACPITGRSLRLTNTGWSFDQADLVQRLQLEKLIFVNDLVAQARGLCEVPWQVFRALQSPMPAFPTGPAAVVNAGTGLGIARIDSFADARVAASEGGHIGFSPNDDVEIELLRLWRGKLGQVTNEHVLSGPGIRRLYQTLGAIAYIPTESIDGPEIVRRAIAEEDALCVETADRFAKILGSVTADICLAFGASAAILAGTIVNALAPLIARSGFRSRFEQRGPGALLKSIPTVTVNEPDLGLLGAYALLVDQANQA